MPDQDVPLGPMKPTHGFSVRQTFGAGGMKHEVTRGGRPGAALPGLTG